MTTEVEIFTNFLTGNNTCWSTDILDSLCEKFLSQNVSAILYLTNTELYGRSTAASQYFLQLAGYLGIPVIAWNADNSGLLRVSSFSSTSVCLSWWWILKGNDECRLIYFGLIITHYSNSSDMEGITIESSKAWFELRQPLLYNMEKYAVVDKLVLTL